MIKFTLFPLIIFSISLYAEDTRDKVLAKELKNIVFFGKENVSKNKKLNLSRECEIIIEDNLLVPKREKFLKQMQVFLGKPLTMRLIDDIRDSVEAYYKDMGYPLVGINMPEGQRVSDGNLFVSVLIAELGQVNAYGARYYPEKWLEKQVSLKPGQDIRTPALLGDLHWINQNPFMNTTIVYEKGKNLSETNIELITRDRLPIRLYGGYENNGYIIAGDSRYFTGINIGRLFLVNDQINAEIMSSHIFEKWWAVAGNYILPFPWRHTLKVFGAYSKTRPKLSDPVNLPDADNQKGFSWQAGGRYIINLPNFTHYFHQTRIGYDFKRTNNFLVFDTTLLFNSEFDISQFIVGYEGSLEGNFGYIIPAIDIYFSPGGMTAFNHNRNFEAESTGARANYVYGKASIDGVIRMPFSFSWEFAALGQAASGKLLPTEQLSVGGALTVRGYDENEVIGDQGFLLRNELRTPATGMLYHAYRKIDDKLQFLIFIDFGWANDVNKNILPDNNEVLASVGPGVRYNIEEYLSFRFDYGFQLNHISNRRFGSDDHHRMHLGLVVGF